MIMKIIVLLYLFKMLDIQQKKNNFEWYRVYSIKEKRSFQYVTCFIVALPDDSAVCFTLETYLSVKKNYIKIYFKKLSIVFHE